MSTSSITHLVTDAANEIKAFRLVVLDVRQMSDVCDYQIICSGENNKQTVAIANSVEHKLKTSLGIRPLAIEGKEQGRWILIDYGSVMVHIFFEPLRDHYGLEDLWAKPSFSMENTGI